MPSIDIAGWIVPRLVLDIATIMVTIALALALHWLAMHALRRVVKRTPGSAGDVFVDFARRPLLFILIALGLAMVRESLDLGSAGTILWTRTAGMIVPALIGWLAINMILAIDRAISLLADVSVADNLRARRRRTRSAILTQIALLAVGFITICLMLLSIPSVRSVGVTLMASAGLVALAVGAAAQPLLKNVIAGVQMAFTEPIRLDDVVIVEGEWGKIEEIRLTYVVIALWDERRLVVPVSKFLEDSFQNWTRTGSQLLGSAFLYLDPTANIPRLREKYTEIVSSNPRWDGRAQVLQVTDMKADAIEVRILATARDAATAFDLRCDLREALLAFVRDDMPEALPRGRTEIERGAWQRPERRGGPL